jgi:threonyl-tRNA synthetase
VKFADRPEKRVGSDAVWDRAEAALKAAVEAAGQKYTFNPGEGAFYGPKLEYALRDAIGREWQCGTLQVDFNLPGGSAPSTSTIPQRQGRAGDAAPGDVRLDRALHRHPDRALCGAFPAVAGAAAGGGGDDHVGGRRLCPRGRRAPRNAGLRVEVDLRNEKIGYKVREHSHAKVPVMIVLGKREVDERAVNIRRLGSKDQESMSLEAAIRGA